MADLFGVLGVATRALLVTQRGVAVTSHNIANVNTPGYSRQQQILESALPVSNAAGQMGMGVEQRTILRVTDGFIERQLVFEQASAGSLNAQAKALSQIDAVLNEQQADGLSAGLSAFYQALDDLASSPDPRQPSERSSLRSVAQSLIDTINRADSQLRDLQRATDRSIVALLPEINELSAQIAKMNEQIVREEAVAPANDLRDQREQLVRELSEKIQVTTFEREDAAIVVMIGGGIPIVDGLHQANLVEEADPSNPFDPTYSFVYFDDGSNFFDVTNEVGSGELGGMLRARDTIIADAIRSLDTVAYNLVDTVNAVHSAGRGLESAAGAGDGALGVDFFAALPQLENAARDVSLDASILASADNIAAGGAAGTGGASDNRNALLLAALRAARAATFVLGDAPGAPTGPNSSVLELSASTLADVGQQARTVEQGRFQQDRILTSLKGRREQASGVSIDEEVTNLVRLQATFQANARVVGVVNQMLDEMVSML